MLDIHANKQVAMTNIYETPQAELIEKEIVPEALASRWARLGAAMIDGVIIGLTVTMPVMYFTGAFTLITQGKQPSITYMLLLGLLSTAAFVVINGKSLVTSGQTIGKKIMAIKIVDLDGNLPGVKKNLLPRYAFSMLVQQIPLVGQYIGFADVLTIFGKKKACLHDMIGKTKVVNC